MKKAIWKSGLGFILLLLLSFTAPARAAEHFVTIYNSFNPSHLQIQFGDTVTWINQGPFFPHTVRSDTSAWATGFLFEEDATFSLTFNALGTFPYRDDGSFATGTITVLAGNMPPSVTITNPASGATFTSPVSFSIQADATDSDGNVVSVQFFVNDISIGTDPTANPYSANANSLFTGDYILSAVATDNLGAKATNSISISVTNPIPSLSSPKLLNGQFQFTVSGLVHGKTTFFQASTDLTNWTSLATNNAANTTQIYTDVQSTNFSRRFYRIVQQVP